jgi:hypothetical protein
LTSLVTVSFSRKTLLSGVSYLRNFLQIFSGVFLVQVPRIIKLYISSELEAGQWKNRQSWVIIVTIRITAGDVKHSTRVYQCPRRDLNPRSKLQLILMPLGSATERNTRAYPEVSGLSR